MFIKIDKVNYFILTEGKSAMEIYQEIFSRMSDKKITQKKMREILSEIKKQVKNK